MTANTKPAAHTPGPWAINGKTRLGWRIDGVIPDIDGLDFLNNPVALIPDEANARLIAAAPEMAASLKELVENYKIGTGNTQAERDARAVLQKAGVL